MESPAFPLPGSSKSAQTYSFFLQPASLTGGSHPPSHVLRSFTFINASKAREKDSSVRR